MSDSGGLMWVFWGGVSSGMGREDVTVHGVRVVFTSMSHLQSDQNLCIYVLYYMFWGDKSPQLLQW